MELYKSKSKNVSNGTFYSCENIISEDCDLYDKESGEIIFCFKKNKIPNILYDKIDDKVIKHAKTISNNRGNASGKTTIKGLNKFQEQWKWEAHPVALVNKNGSEISEEDASSSSFFKYADGRLSKRARSNNVMSQAIGGFDKSNKFPCRLTHWTNKNFEEYKSMWDLCKWVSHTYFLYFPHLWYKQYEVYEYSPQDLIIPDTNFSTITLNCNFRTACHEDRGDYKNGLTCFTTMKTGDYTGGELIFPEYDICVNVEQGDLLMFNPHIAHCNNEINGEGRISFVLYLREKMADC